MVPSGRGIQLGAGQAQDGSVGCAAAATVGGESGRGLDVLLPCLLPRRLSFLPAR